MISVFRKQELEFTKEKEKWDEYQTEVFRRILDDPDNVWYQYLMSLSMIRSKMAATHNFQ